MKIRKWSELTFWAEDLLNSHYVVVVKDRQVLYFAQGCQWETHIRRFIHDHIELLQCKKLLFACVWTPVLSAIDLAKSAFTNLFDFIKIWKLILVRVGIWRSLNTVTNLLLWTQHVADVFLSRVNAGWKLTFLCGLPALGWLSHLHLCS